MPGIPAHRAWTDFVNAAQAAADDEEAQDEEEEKPSEVTREDLERADETLSENLIPDESGKISPSAVWKDRSKAVVGGWHGSEHADADKTEEGTTKGKFHADSLIDEQSWQELIFTSLIGDMFYRPHTSGGVDARTGYDHSWLWCGPRKFAVDLGKNFVVAARTYIADEGLRKIWPEYAKDRLGDAPASDDPTLEDKVKQEKEKEIYKILVAKAKERAIAHYEGLTCPMPKTSEGEEAPEKVEKGPWEFHAEAWGKVSAEFLVYENAMPPPGADDPPLDRDDEVWRVDRNEPGKKFVFDSVIYVGLFQLAFECSSRGGEPPPGYLPDYVWGSNRPPVTPRVSDRSTSLGPFLAQLARPAISAVPLGALLLGYRPRDETDTCSLACIRVEPQRGTLSPS